MPGDTKLVVPSEVAAFAEQGVRQTREACDSLLEATHKAMDHAGRQADAFHENARQMADMTLGFAEANLTAGFDFAARLAGVRTMAEWSRLQSEFVTEQARRLSDQAKQLHEAGVAQARAIVPSAKP